jgi:virulence-associated protein VagC
METAKVTSNGDVQTVILPKGIHLPETVFVRRDGDSILLVPSKESQWPAGFFESIHISDPLFVRAPQGELPPSKDF